MILKKYGAMNNSVGAISPEVAFVFAFILRPYLEVLSADGLLLEVLGIELDLSEFKASALSAGLSLYPATNKSIT